MSSAGASALEHHFLEMMRVGCGGEDKFVRRQLCLSGLMLMNINGAVSVRKDIAVTI